ncbi:MAG: hypothetical protein K0M40_16335 [Prolixibacteraceae bacterium]|nr:hypothetical protein [Prolixibacteraceae bacterium]
MRRYYWLVLFLFSLMDVSGQKLEAEAEIILQSRHVWRGSQLGDAIAVEPSVTLSSGRFSFNFWAAKTTNNSYSEIDLIPAYQFNHFQLTLFDYYNPVADENNQYLNFQKGKNRHSLELSLDNYLVENQRVKWMIGTFLLGDKNEETGNPFYSTYIELKYPFTVLGIQTEPFAGLSPFRGYYADKFAFINAGISFGKEFELTTGFSIPLSLSVICNPYQNQRFVVISSGIYFSAGN